MNVLLLSTFAHYGGAALACRRLHTALTRSGLCDAKLLTRDLPAPFQQITAGELGYWGKQRAWARFVAERLQVRWAVKHKSLQYAFSPASWGQSLYQHEWVQQADVLNLHWINFGFLSLKGLKELASLEKKMVWTLHDMWAFTGGCHYADDCTNFLQQCGNCQLLKSPKASDLSHKVWNEKQAILKDLKGRLKIVASSQWLAEVAKQSALLQDFPVQNIAIPIDSQQFSPMDKKTLRKQWGIPDDKFVLLFSAMNIHDKRKGFAYLVEALTLLYQQSPETRERLVLAIVGKAGEKDIPLPYPVYYLGSLATPEAMNEAYNIADAFALPSLEDNLPNTIMEAMACGLPCVAFSTGGLPEMIIHEKIGYLATLKQAQSFAEGIRYVCNHNDLPALSQAARNFAKENYNEQAIAQQYVNVYK